MKLYILLQGIKNNDHFGFICREVNGDLPCYVGYVFMCQISAVTDEIMQGKAEFFHLLIF